MGLLAVAWLHRVSRVPGAAAVVEVIMFVIRDTKKHILLPIHKRNLFKKGHIQKLFVPLYLPKITPQDKEEIGVWVEFSEPQFF